MEKELILKKRGNLNRKRFGEYLSFFVFILLISLSGLIGAQETVYCAEKTTYGAFCQNVPLSEVNIHYRYERTSCERTSYCSSGTCVNTVAGNCVPSPQATCDSTKGGIFYNQPRDEVAQCQIGCCLLGDGAALVERVKCDTLGKDYNVKATFRSDIQDESQCLALASPEAKGACIFETDRGKDCKTITRGECQTSGGSFSQGLLCTAPELGTLCAKTKRTTCVEGRNEVYFVDSCGNIANIYDANKIEDIAYWSYVPGVEGVEINKGDGKGNVGSPIYGYCDYLEGSTCRPYDRTIDSSPPKYGDYTCRDLSCSARLPLAFREKRAHGEEWCSEPIEAFQIATPGQLSYLLYCFEGEIHFELCDNFRNKLCLEDKDTGAAGCIPNLWMECILQNNTRDCENIGDCRVVTGASVLRTEYGTGKTIRNSDTGQDMVGTCVPKYVPGSKFWDISGTMLDNGEDVNDISSICNFASVVCVVPYSQEVIGITSWRVEPSNECIELCREKESWSKSECFDACKPVCLEEKLDSKNALAKINGNWARNWQNLCISMGDCGVGGNYVGIEGYNRWKDLFLGDKIDWMTLPNANSKK